MRRCQVTVWRALKDMHFDNVLYSEDGGWDDSVDLTAMTKEDEDHLVHQLKSGAATYRLCARVRGWTGNFKRAGHVHCIPGFSASVGWGISVGTLGVAFSALILAPILSDPC